MHTTPGIYCYTIKQNSATNERGHYDQTVYYVRVTVTNGENGDLETVIAAHITGEMTDAKRDILFKNYYEPVESPTESTTETRSTTETKPEPKPAFGIGRGEWRDSCTCNGIGFRRFMKKRGCLWYKEQMLYRFCVTKLENESATERVV